MDEINNPGIPDNNIASGNDQQDQIKQLKSEFNRKVSNVDEKLAMINQQLTQLSLLGNNVQTPQSNINQAPQRPDPVIDPDGYDRYIKAQMSQEMDARLNTQQRQQAEIAQLVNQFPELSDPQSDFSRAAIQAYNNLSPQEKGMPGAYKLAIQSTALDLGVLPKNKRQSSQPKGDESDDLGARNSTNTPPQSKKGKGKLDEATLAFAQMLGRDTSDQKYLERLQKASSRQKWGSPKTRNEY